MGKSQISPAALAAVTVAGALALMLLPGAFTWLTSIGGLTLLLILLAYDQDGYRSVFQSLAFSAVCGLCLVLMSAIVFQLLSERAEGHTTDGRFASEWLPLTWLCASGLFCVIDRARMSGRLAITTQQLPVGVPAHRSFIPDFTSPSAPAASDVARPQRFASQPAQAEPIRVEAPISEQAPVPVRPGKETMIYVNLVGEGLNVLRSVKAEHLGRDFYKIIDSMSEGETWEYQPGQVVRCKKKNLSNGKGLVATEEAPRA